MSTKFSPGAVVTVGDLEVGDTVFLRDRIAQTGGERVPIAPVRVTALTPIPNGRVRVQVRNANSGTAIEPRLLGDLPATREFRSAVEAA